MRANATATLVAVVALIVAGCVGEASPTTTSSAAPPPAPAPTTGVTTGALSGQVVDDEVRPVVKATVALTETQAEIETDADGRFTFNDLEPGTYRLLVQKLGYETVGLKADVIAGEITEKNIVLKPLPVDVEGYVLVKPRSAMMHVSVTSLTSLQNDSVIQSYACNPCRLPMHLDKNPLAIVSEVAWADGPTPVVNAGLNVWYYKDWSGDGLGTNICFWQPSVSPFRVEWSETCVTGAKGKDKLLVHIQPGPIPGIVAVELRVDTWTSFFYNLEVAEGYTALPPA